MSWDGVVDWLMRSWWIYDAATTNSLGLIYRYFNLIEALIWIALALLVAFRYTKHRKSLWEIAYAVSFATFAVTDLRESNRLETWLIFVKAINLGLLLTLRHYILRNHYPTSRVY